MIADARIQLLMHANSSALLLLHMNHFVQTRITTNQGAKKRVLICPCADALTHAHVFACPIIDLHW